jgi:hypothetical protein
MSATLVVKPTNKTEAGEGQIRIDFYAPYDNPANKEWAKYTPALQLSFVVKDEEVASNFVVGQEYVVTFTPKDS